MTIIPSNVIEYFSAKYNISLPEANILFSKLDEFLTSAENSRQSPSYEIDEAWHIFILHSKEYSNYCLTKFGRFIHHVPDLLSDSKSSNFKCSNCSRCSSNCRSN